MSNERHGHAARPIAAMVLPPKEGFSPQSVGAIGLLVMRLARASLGFENVVLGAAPAFPPFPGLRFLPVRGAMLAGRPLNWVYARMAARVLRKLGPSVIEVHNRPKIALALARRFPNIPVLLFLHNDPQSAHGAQTGRHRQKLLERLAGVVVVSNWMRARLLEDVPPTARRPALLLNCIDLAELPPQLPDDRRQPHILFVGRQVHNKGADSFVAAAGHALAALPGWQAIAIGADGFGTDTDETVFLRDLRKAAKQAGVELVGYRGHRETMEAMAHAAIVVAPSRWEEPFGLVALEALANGAALICSARGALPEVAGDAALYIDPEDVAGLADAIIALARAPSRRAALAARGRARAQLFDVGTAAAALDALRLEALAAAARPGNGSSAPDANAIPEA